MRRDAVRNRERVLAAGRAALEAGDSIQLNEIARAAGVGVGTVYRHFPATGDLLEAIVADKLEILLAEAQDATSLADPGAALEAFIARSLHLQSADPSLATILAATTDAQPSTTKLKSSLGRTVERLIERARDVHAVRDDLRSAELRDLVSGIAYANRLSGASTTSTRRYLDIVLRGIRA
jgi:AcrR family transcriptional regulator